ncbi:MULTISPECIES: DUF4292 domain-containing protein [Cellulophaga]|uniref:Deoxyuridine 5'-triphosphate nucleotidohydrolase n=1 Tax=Cellulophaga geojensis KL-A TaxID=1328323 RepID=A0ABP3B2R5_9FLAO|nr:MULTISPECIES: DUF4292 domain-containing protein [Cellulophaga]AIM60351.1 deoxyuridine 5'-triphosphate nucleotidohydrolase [Cellulophaga lytica]APU10215.1 deoxyuridine 5'-triphosphate nucleotidohydrolase [Cellulophaga lytica]EWH10791.1 deoxyuridine 5'-triphosphate nucleotidohydrolase [Cellulophaga geojensis KL-A]SNQ43774.1 Conserved hypothetical membrane protein [Cellulophaga lytica]
MIKKLQTTPKILLALIVVLFFVSCKSKKVIAEGTSTLKKLNTKTVVKNHYANTLDFKTLRGRLKIDYTDGTDTQGYTVSFRMEKDKAIWISATLGVVKAYITPTRVSFYNRLQNEYFDGDFTYLSNLLGTELDYNKVQNLLLGQALFDLRKEKYNTVELNNQYQLAPKKANNLFKTLLQIEPNNYKVAGMQLSQPLKNRVLNVQYKNYQVVDKKLVPNIIDIYVKDQDKTDTIALTFKNIELNKSFSFPYKIPNGFKEIVLE